MCTIQGCLKEASAPRGMCWAHYKRFLRYRDPEAGATFQGTGLEWLMNAIRTDTDECLPYPEGETDAYGALHFEGVRWRAPQLLCHTVYGPAEGRLTRHLCKTKRCCNKKHVVWGTALENMQDRRRDDTHLPGARNPNAKLTEDDIRKIRALRGALPQAVIADMFGTSQANVGDIQRRKTWVHVL